MSNDDVSEPAFVVVKPHNSSALKLLMLAIDEAENSDDFVRTTRVFYDQSGAISRPNGIQNPEIRLFLDNAQVPINPEAGWLFGRSAAKEVDVKIAPNSSKNVAPVQFILLIHPRSGVVILKAGAHTTNTVQYQKAYSTDFHTMQPDSFFPLIGPTTVISFAGYQFSLNLVLFSEGGKSLSTSLSSFVLRAYGETLHKAASHFCGSDNRTRCDTHFLGDLLGSGTFADVHYCVCGMSGEPSALKLVRTRNSVDRQRVCEEVQLQQECASAYVVQVLKSWCRHGANLSMCKKHTQDMAYILMPLGVSDFSNLHLTQKTEYSTSEILTFFKHAMIGIAGCHKKGVMHRDITQANLYVMSVSPPRAAVGDFGKAVRKTHSFSTGIGPVAYCAPEVWLGKGYGLSIDIYMWAIVWITCLGYKLPAREKITFKRHEEMCTYLGKTLPKDLKSFEGLLLGCLCWDPQRRLTAEEVLADPAWQTLRKRSVDSGDNEEEMLRGWKAPRQDTVQGSIPTTVAFSEEE